MRNSFLIIFILFGWQILFSSPDPVIRYKVKVELENAEILEGYIYRISIMGAPHFDKNEKSFLNYFREVHIPDTLKLYKEIRTYQLNNYIELDFTSSEHKIVFLKQDIKKLQLLEEFEYQIGSRLQEIEEEVYANLDFKKLNYTTSYNERFAENCYLLLISEMNLIKLKECQEELENGLNETLNIPPKTPNVGYEVNQYLNNEKECLRQKNILLLLYWDAL